MTETTTTTTPDENTSPDATPTVTTPPVDLTTEDGLRLVLATAGDARVDDLPGLVQRLASLRDRLTSAAREAKRALNARKAVAEESANLRRFILTPSGPDWAAKTQAYRDIVNATMEAAFPVSSDFSKDDKNREITAIRQHVNRTFLEVSIRQYVRDTNEGMPSATEADTEQFKHLVKGEYKRCGLTVPRRYLNPEEIAGLDDSGSGGGNGGGAANPAEAAISAIAGLGELTPKYAALQLLAGISTFADVIDKGNAEGGVTDRDDVKALALRFILVANYCRKALDQKASPADREEIAKVVITDEDRKV